MKPTTGRRRRLVPRSCRRRLRPEQLRLPPALKSKTTTVRVHSFDERATKRLENMIVLLLFKINKLVNVGRNKPKVVDAIRVKDIHITHLNTIESILFWYNKFDYIFWLYSSVYIHLLHENMSN
jgi:hypothetical protein